MLDNLNGSNQTDILNRINAARSAPEPSEPTEAIELQEQEPENIEVEAQADAEIDSDELESNEAEIATDQDEAEEFYVDINGREISFSQIHEWEQGHLRQSDYTRKTTLAADERKALATKSEEYDIKAAKLEENIAALESFIGDFDNNDFDGMSLDELREVDPGQYLKVKEDNEKRKAVLEKAKATRSGLSSEQQQEQEKAELQIVLKNNPQWVEGGKETKDYQNDMSIVKNYLDTLGYSEAKQKGILSQGHGQAYIDAARYHASKKANNSLAKQVRKAPVVSKPGGASKSLATQELESAQANHKKYGTTQTAFALRKAQQKFKGK